MKKIVYLFLIVLLSILGLFLFKLLLEFEITSLVQFFVLTSLLVIAIRVVLELISFCGRMIFKE